MNFTKRLHTLTALLVVALLGGATVYYFVYAGTTNFDALSLSGALTVTGTSTLTGDVTLSGDLIHGSTTISEAEITPLDAVTAGTLSASDAVVVDASSQIDVWDVTGKQTVGGQASFAGDGYARISGNQSQLWDSNKGSLFHENQQIYNGTCTADLPNLTTLTRQTVACTATGIDADDEVFVQFSDELLAKHFYLIIGTKVEAGNIDVWMTNQSSGTLNLGTQTMSYMAFD